MGVSSFMRAMTSVQSMEHGRTKKRPPEGGLGRPGSMHCSDPLDADRDRRHLREAGDGVEVLVVRDQALNVDALLARSAGFGRVAPAVGDADHAARKFDAAR